LDLLLEIQAGRVDSNLSVQLVTRAAAKHPEQLICENGDSSVQTNRNRLLWERYAFQRNNWSGERFKPTMVIRRSLAGNSLIPQLTSTFFCPCQLCNFENAADTQGTITRACSRRRPC